MLFIYIASESLFICDTAGLFLFSNLDHSYLILSTPTAPRIDSHKSKCDALAANFPNIANSANPTSTIIGLHIFMIHRPNFEGNEMNFEVVMNRQT